MKFISSPKICSLNLFCRGRCYHLIRYKSMKPIEWVTICNLCRLWSCASCLHAESTPILVVNKWPYHRWSPFAYDFLCPFPGCLHTFVQIFSHVTGRLARFAWLHLGFGRQSRSTVSPKVRLRSIIIIFILVVWFGLVWFDLVSLFVWVLWFISISVDCKNVHSKSLKWSQFRFTPVDMAKLNNLPLQPPSTEPDGCWRHRELLWVAKECSEKGVLKGLSWFGVHACKKRNELYFVGFFTLSVVLLVSEFTSWEGFEGEWNL